MRPADQAAVNRRRVSEMASLQSAIQHLHVAITEMPHPKHKSALAAALNTLTTVQADHHSKHEQGETSES